LWYADAGWKAKKELWVRKTEIPCQVIYLHDRNGLGWVI
jgi:hypothetical protein